jgi:hypothetical protein
MTTLSIKTTANCNLHCRDCPVVPWMKSHPNYQLSLDNLRHFVEVTKESRYHFDYIAFGGGEPFLWEHLAEGVEIVAGSGITDGVRVFTNGTLLHKNRDLARSVRRHATIVANPPQIGHWKLPQEPVAGAVPAKCACTHYSLIMDRVEACGLARYLLEYLDGDIDDHSGASTPIASGYLSKLDGKERFSRWWCAYCISNEKVRQAMPRRKRV